MGMRGGLRGAVPTAVAPNKTRTMRSPGQRLPILLVVAEAGRGADARAELEAAGCDVRVAELAGALDDAARRIAAQAEEERLIVCDCAGDEGCERAFFLCRAGGERAIVLFAVGDGVADEPVEVLAAAMRKALPASRIALLSDRINERERPSGGACRSRLSAERTAHMAAVLCAIADRSKAWPESANFYI